MSDRARLSTALLFSILFHAALVSLLNGVRLLSAEIPAASELLDIDLIEMPAVASAPAPAPPAPAAPVAEAPPAAVVPESRIVPMPEAGREVPSEDARFLSDRDNVVDEESVRRGPSLDVAGQDDPGQQEEEQAAAEPLAEDEAIPPPAAEPVAPVERAPAPRVGERSGSDAEPGAAGAGAPRTAPRDIALADLLPRPGDIALADPRPAGGAPAEEEPAPARRDLLPGRRVRFSSGSGIATLLPSVRDGDVTMLNTKAHQFAPFVRRVATRVFQHVQIKVMESARRGAAGSGREFVVVRATMSPDGNFRHAVQREARSETRLSVPRLLLGVIGPRTFFDENPPPGAVSGDGDIHFDLTIDLRVWSEDYRDVDSARRVPLTQFEGYLGVSLLE